MSSTADNQSSSRMRRVQRDATKESFIQELCTGQDACFSEIWRLLIFAALLGYFKDIREPLAEVEPKNTLRQEVFHNSPLWPGMIHLFAILDKRDPVCLSEESWQNSLTLFEEYANGGLNVLQNAVIEGSSVLHNLVGFLQSVSADSNNSNGIDLSKIKV